MKAALLVTALWFAPFVGGHRVWANELHNDDPHPERINSTQAEATAVSLPSEDSASASSEHGSSGSHSPVSELLLAIVLVLAGAKLAGDFFHRLSLPPVLGELVVGILLGNIAMMSGWTGLEFLHAPADAMHAGAYHTGAALKMLAEIGVVLLLFEVGLESNVTDMLRVGKSSFAVATLGVVAPMILGVAVGMWLLSDSPWQVHMFLGATLCATSVGITARVLKDLGRSQQRESRIILGAAVIDDVLGLVVLSIVQGIIVQGANFQPIELLWIVLKSFGFLVASTLLGAHLLAKPLFKLCTYLRGHGLLVVAALMICFTLSYLSSLIGLAPIVGAFAAGLILDHAHYAELSSKEEWGLERAISPLTSLFVPIFFVQMGVMVDLSSFANPQVWGLAAALTIAAIIGKQVCAFGVFEKGLDRLSVGLGMIPRGEVGLIFAGVGLSLSLNGAPIVSGATYSALILMVILTTMLTPPLLKWSMTRHQQEKVSVETSKVILKPQTAVH